MTGRYGFALHTTTPDLGLALDNFVDDRHQLVLHLGRDLASELHFQMAEFLYPRRWCDLKWLAVAKGPGGFTGARMGLVVARTLAQQLDLPLFALSTLAAYAFQQWQTGAVAPEQAIALDMRAQRGQCFTALYQLSSPEALPQALMPDQVMDPDTWQATLEVRASELSFCALTVPDTLADSVVALLHLAERAYALGDRPSWLEAKPFYGQHPVSLSATPPSTAPSL